MNTESSTNPNSQSGIDLAIDEKRILERLGAAVLLQWNDLPTNLQRSIFDDATLNIDPQRQIAVKKEIARFLHDHKDDV